MKKPLKKRLVFSVLLLPCGLFGSIALLLLLVFLEVEVFKSTPQSDQLIPNIFEGLLGLFIGAITFLGFLIWWIRRLIKDFIRFKKVRPFAILSFLILLLPFSPVLFLAFREGLNATQYYLQRKSATSEVESYSVLTPQNVRRIICTINRNDSLYLLAAKSDFKYSNDSEQIRLNSGTIWADEMQLYILNSGHLSLTKELSVDTIRKNTGLYWDVPTLPTKGFNHQSCNDHKISIGPPALDHETLILGFDQKSRGYRSPEGFNYLRENGTFWYLFYTEEPGEKLTKIHLAEVHSSGYKIHLIYLEDGHEKVFDGSQILALHRDRETFSIIADTAILQFNLE